MPYFDGTGPLGYGPGTGWGRGPCGAGLARRRGYGRYGYGWTYPYSKEEESRILKEHIQYAEEALKNMKDRLTELENEKEGSKSKEK